MATVRNCALKDSIRWRTATAVDRGLRVILKDRHFDLPEPHIGIPANPRQAMQLRKRFLPQSRLIWQIHCSQEHRFLSHNLRGVQLRFLGRARIAVDGRSGQVVRGRFFLEK